MRFLKQNEIRKRGCKYCADKKGVKRMQCPYKKCPYTVLDKYKSYGAFLLSKDSLIPGIGV